MNFPNLQKSDPVLYGLVQQEIQRQQDTIDLIPSESLVPLALLEVLGSPLTNKYSEGEVNKRYYPGNGYYDQIETLAKQRAKEAFGLGEEWEVNVQPLSGSPANLAVYFGLLNPGDTIMGMSLASGGHLTHGHKVNVSGRIFKSSPYEVGLDGRLNFEQIEALASKNQPRIIISGYTAHPLKIDFAEFGRIAKSIGAWHLADVSHIAGLIAAGYHPSPFPYADVVTMTTHKTLNGPRAAVIFAKKDLIAQINKAVFPGLQGGPHNHQIAAIALAFGLTKRPEFKRLQQQITLNAATLAAQLLEYGFNLVGGTSENHLLLIDLKNKNISGGTAQNLLEQAGINANRNSVPGDTSPFNPSGLRMGTPSITFRGMREAECLQIAAFLDRLLSKKESPFKIKDEVLTLCQEFPTPYNITK